MRAQRSWVTACAAMVAGMSCGSPQRAPLAPAGDEKDDGAGQLAQASTRLSTSGDDTAPGFAEPRRTASTYNMAYGGAAYGGDPYGAPAYGGATYAGWVVPQWSYAPPARVPRYNVIGGLHGAVEGTVKWTGPMPGKLTSACGPIDNPTLRVGSDKAARGIVVYIEKVAVGRAIPSYSRPAGVGGTLAKRGCTLVPAVQIIAPLPTSISIHGDDQRAKIRVAGEKTPPGVYDLQEGGLVQLEVKPGVTRVEADGSKLSPAWVLGLETPYYAITDDAGRYRIDELAPGTYELTFWQPPIASAKPDGTFTYGQPIVMKRSVTIGAQTAQLSVSMGR